MNADFSLTFPTNLEIGFSETVCVHCKYNGDDIVNSFAPLTITQLPIDCGDVS